MTIPRHMKAEYQRFLLENGFDQSDPQALLLDLASLSMDVYLKEIVWLSDFIGRIQQTRRQVA